MAKKKANKVFVLKAENVPAEYQDVFIGDIYIGVQEASVKSGTVSTEEPVQKANIPFNIRRELEEIGKSLGFTADEKIAELEGDIPELIKFCNAHNYPPNSWRERWEK